MLNIGWRCCNVGDVNHRFGRHHDTDIAGRAVAKRRRRARLGELGGRVMQCDDRAVEDAVLDASRRFVFDATRPRALEALPPALERRFIACPVC